MSHLRGWGDGKEGKGDRGPGVTRETVGKSMNIATD